MSEENKSVYMLGAEDGLLMGPLMTAAIVLCGMSTYYAWVSIPALVCLFAVPVLAYFRLAYGYRKGGCRMSFSGLWLRGICMFFFGSLILAAVVFVLLRWFDPGFVIHQIDKSIEIYNSMGNKEMADTLAVVKKSEMLPTALDMSLMLIYIAVFSGSILSLIYAAIIRRSNRNIVPPPYNPNI